MPIETLDTNEAGSYTDDGGTSNNGKVNAAIAILRKQVIEIGPFTVPDGATLIIRKRVPQAATVTRVGVIADTVPGAAAATLDIAQGANAITAAQIDLAALVADTESAPALHATPANLQLAVGYLTFTITGAGGATPGSGIMASVEVSLN